MLTVTATDLPRLMACNGSRLMGESTPPVDTDDTVRDEGNAADWYCQQVHAGNTPDVGTKTPNGIFVIDEMVEHLEEYLKGIVQAEIEVDTSHFGTSWEINGRADRVDYNADTQCLWIADLKYGWSLVEPEDNWTLISHAIGWVINNSDKPVKSIKFTIFQPRQYHPLGAVRVWTIDYHKLMELCNIISHTLSNPDDQLNTNPHCRNCPHITSCPASTMAGANAIDASYGVFVDDIKNENLSFELDNIDRAVKVLTQRQKAFKELALHRIKEGQIINNYSLDTSLSNREWYKHVTPELMKMLTGIDLTKKQLITPKQAENAGVSEHVTAAMTERRNKGVKLVRMDANAKAKKMFN